MKKLTRFTNTLIKDYNLNANFVVEDIYWDWHYEDIKCKDEFGINVYNLDIWIHIDKDVDSVVQSNIRIQCKKFDMCGQFYDWESLKFCVNAIMEKL